jgi:hypothetical protein
MNSVIWTLCKWRLWGRQISLWRWQVSYLLNNGISLMVFRTPCRKLLRGLVELFQLQKQKPASRQILSSYLSLGTLRNTMQGTSFHLGHTGPTPKKKRKTHFTRCVWNNRIIQKSPYFPVVWRREIRMYNWRNFSLDPPTVSFSAP